MYKRQQGKTSDDEHAREQAATIVRRLRQYIAADKEAKDVRKKTGDEKTAWEEKILEAVEVIEEQAPAIAKWGAGPNLRREAGASREFSRFMREFVLANPR